MISAQTKPDVVIRAIQYRDIEAVNTLLTEAEHLPWISTLLSRPGKTQDLFQRPEQLVNVFPLGLQSPAQTFVAQGLKSILGVIQVMPCNQARTTWKVNALAVAESQSLIDLGSELLQHCLRSLYEAHTWLVELDVNYSQRIGLYRQNGFQPLAHATHWSLRTDQLQQLAQKPVALPNLISINNADSALLYQLDTVAMPPFVRQVLDRRVQDFTQDLLSGLWEKLQQTWSSQKNLRGYIFEPQRKVAIGHFELCLCRDGSVPHIGQMTVHPAYTWLYPELLSHMAGLTQTVDPMPLHLTSTDYQSEREDYLGQIEAERVGHSIMMSRSVWHKLRETRWNALETLPLAEVLQGLQPKQTPIPGRMKETWIRQ
ncbi:GNAT family N-acetyltransferase [Lyngbya confervoides]|uniref:GNAT family N-acetyltransferase n=1 Tax=Lyngbya confervoides BDU141951 TaxID=1574623 RepID=A0ABD4SYZ3_9CYAN|nr:GNAT family N-acetyltransferase [Lyngbya confervoides]MCM1981360.1 GNAT family N-acetyltransferase [Lyngbya confervoides BDU141951]